MQIGQKLTRIASLVFFSTMNQSLIRSVFVATAEVLNYQLCPNTSCICLWEVFMQNIGYEIAHVMKCVVRSTVKQAAPEANEKKKNFDIVFFFSNSERLKLVHAVCMCSLHVPSAHSVATWATRTISVTWKGRETKSMMQNDAMQKFSLSLSLSPLLQGK